MKALVKDELQLLALMHEIAKAGDFPLEISAKKAGKRSLDANAVIHVWYKQIAEQFGHSIPYTEGYCKLTFGIPILLERGDKAAKMISYTFDKLSFRLWPHEKKIDYMEIMPVTRLMTTAEHCNYREQMQRYYAEQGLFLDYL